ncbi:MAG: transketolase-like TK C-terminal-containing protein, partial [Halanaerobium sp.]
DEEEAKAAWVEALETTDQQDADTIIFASGSEVNLAEESAEILADKGIKAAVMSVPEKRKLEEYAAEHELPEVKLRVAVEAGVTNSWYKLVGRDGLVIGLDRFGLSGKGQEVGEDLGFKAEKVAAKIEAALK